MSNKIHSETMIKQKKNRKARVKVKISITFKYGGNYFGCEARHLRLTRAVSHSLKVFIFDVKNNKNTSTLA